jgi:hypothetical protein
MTEPLNPGSHAAEVELQIDQVTIVNPAEATTTVRSILGPVPRGARFDHIGDSAEAIDLELTQILAYFGRSVDELDPVHNRAGDPPGHRSPTPGLSYPALPRAGHPGNQPAAITKPSTGIDYCSVLGAALDTSSAPIPHSLQATAGAEH